MSRRVRRKLLSRGQEEVGGLGIDENQNVDWTRLPDDTVIQLFASLNLRDRASLSSTCRAWRVLGMSECLWQQLDLRSYKFDSAIAPSLASRCENLKKIRFRSAESAEAIIHLKARGLREISGEYCRKITDATLAMIVARHEALESLQLGPDFCERITTSAIKAVAVCCPCLRKLRLCGLRYVDGDAINALAKHCKNLMDIGFIDCLNVDEAGIGQILSLKFLSVAGTTNMKWILASQHWSELPNLIGLDVSRTDIPCSAVERMFLASKSLKVLCALYCPALDKSATFLYNNNNKGKLLLTLCTDIFKEVASLFINNINKERNIFLEWRQLSTKVKKPEDIMHWIEWVISHSLLRIAEVNPQGLDTFWLNQGAYVFLSLTQSTQEEVQERAATGIATFVVIDEESSTVDAVRAEAVMKDGGIRLLLNLAKCWQDGIQSEVTKAIANLSMNGNVAKAVAEEGGISILANLARSMNRLVAEEAAGGLWNLSVGEEHKMASIAETGGLKALVGLIFRWLVNGGEVVLERAAGALANLAADEKCSMEIASVGGVQALVTLAQNCKVEGVQEQAARALANLAAHGDSNNNNASVGQEAGALEALVLLTHSPHDGVRQEAAGALWNLSFDDSNRETIAATGGVEALVALAKSCFDASPALQERAAGALWGLSVSETNSIAIGQEGGIAPLIALARVEVEDVHETAAGALWNLAFNPGNALRIVEEGGVPALVHLCSTSVSKMARFMATLALAYIFDGRMDEVALVGSSSDNASKSVNLNGARRMALRYIEAFVLAFSDPQAFSAAAASSAPTALTQVTELARIHEAGHLRCSGAEIGRFVKMLQNPSSVLKACAAFALVQFTIRSGRHANHHARLLQNPSASRILRAAAASASAPLEAKIFARIVLRNLEHYQRQNLLLH